MLPWAEIETVLLDMDGTLLDLRFDNHLWNVVVPRRYAQRQGIDSARAATILYDDMLAARPRLDYYDLDFWTAATRLDIDAIHAELSSLIRYRPGAADFVAAVRASGRPALLTTNAHPRSVAVKHRATGLLDRLDDSFDAFRFGAPKEEPGFWDGLAARIDFDRAATLLIDDNAEVLASAERAGIAHLLCVAQPDSGAERPTDNLPFTVFDHFAQIMPPSGCAAP